MVAQSGGAGLLRWAKVLCAGARRGAKPQGNTNNQAVSLLAPPSPAAHAKLQTGRPPFLKSDNLEAYADVLLPRYLAAKLTEPLPTTDGGTLRTIDDAVRYMTALPKQRELSVMNWRRFTRSPRRLVRAA